ncbi:hypothetical protein UFOVP410_114 [uncultured Caudovirales phage]|uniref:Uncharacterized protein n=1 Tax=uncultured Caudovirales phage TaxID=2100421 RepID=A0A6J5M2V8_9CAUD|nr:hypothetical protein UFOVP410_114 [uncultured Caudovirales phage]
MMMFFGFLKFIFIFPLKSVWVIFKLIAAIILFLAALPFIAAAVFSILWIAAQSLLVIYVALAFLLNAILN